MPVTLFLILVLLPFAWICWKLFNSLRAMEVGIGVGVVLSGDENPTLFRAVIAVQCGLIVLLLAIIWYVTLVLLNPVMS